MAKGDISVREAGKKGGTTTSKRHGKGFYQEIGFKGGKNSHRGKKQKNMEDEEEGESM